MKYLLVALPTPALTSLFTYKYDGNESALFKRVSVPFGSRKMTGIVIEESESADPSIEYRMIDRIIDKSQIINEESLYIAKRMKSIYMSNIGVNLSLMVPGAKREANETPSFSDSCDFERIENLSEDQKNAIESILNGIKENKRLFYLAGVTGSGKSEVYLRLAENVIRNGKQVLYLVPEITLSEQIKDSVSKRFSSRVRIIHSSLTPSERLKALMDIKKGDADILIGARSAVFSPFSNLGLIILDEEHENTYKSQNTPRYHARQIAQMRSEYSSIPLVMGSATPSFESYHLMRKGLIRRIDMPHRVGEGHFPSIRIVDMRNEKGNISKVLYDAMKKELDDKKGVILFLNRRGYSHSIMCSTCSSVIKCPNCSVNMTYHKDKGRLLCHTCGKSIPLVHSCPSCGSMDLISTGSGTERIEEELMNLFPLKRIKRLDSDSVKGKSYVKDTLKAFERGEIDILLGTQMIAKGLNFPLVTLVGVINADTSLFSPDFRANERTFDLLQQVAGRVGRYRNDGHVIIQTTQITNPAIRAVEMNDQEAFYSEELEMRRMVSFPPFSRLVNLTVRSRIRECAQKEAERLESELFSLLENLKGVDVYSAGEALIEKKKGYYRYHLLLRSESRSFKSMLETLSVFFSSYKAARNTYLEIDTDPVDIT